MVATALPHPGAASLPMYDFDELRPAHDQLWAAVAARLDAQSVPLQLTHDADVHRLWHAPDLVVSQACGWPIVDELDARIQVFGAFCYDAPAADRDRPHYRSRIVMRADRPNRCSHDGLTAAVNSFASLSGWLSLVRAYPSLDGTWPGDVVETGAHVASLAALGEGRADIAAIDGVTFALVQRHRPHLLAGLEVVHEGPLIPCLPLITHLDATPDDLAALRAAFHDALDVGVGHDVLDALLITRFHALDASAYEPVRALASAWQSVRR